MINFNELYNVLYSLVFCCLMAPVRYLAQIFKHQMNNKYLI